MRPGRLLGVAVLALLAAGAAYAVGGRGPSAPLSTFPTTLPAPSSTSRSVPPTTIAPTTLTSEAPEPHGDPLAVTEKALDGWGRFAVTGDLAQVAEWFHPDGPQWDRFHREAPGLAAEPLGDPPYTVVADRVQVERRGRVAVVEARVRFVRTGEPSQSFLWSLRLRRGEDGWRVWTVEEVQPGSSGIPSP